MGSSTVGESPQLGLIQSYLTTNWAGVQSTIEKTILGVSYCKLYPTKNTKIGFEILKHWK